MKQEAIDSFMSVTKELLSTLEGLDGVGDSFLYRYFKVFKMVKAAKEANNILNTGYNQLYIYYIVNFRFFCLYDNLQQRYVILPSIPAMRLQEQK